jgi:hypothetical protein
MGFMELASSILAQMNGCSLNWPNYPPVIPLQKAVTRYVHECMDTFRCNKLGSHPKENTYCSEAKNVVGREKTNNNKDHIGGETPREEK